MYLTLKDLAFLFRDRRGADEDVDLYTVTDNSQSLQPKGLFVPVDGESGELFEAITHGAIAAIWDKNKKVPGITPNHFPLFLTDDPVLAVQTVLHYYLEKVNGEEKRRMETSTQFNFFSDKLLNKKSPTYDIAVKLEKISNTSNSERRG